MPARHARQRRYVNVTRLRRVPYTVAAVFVGLMIGVGTTGAYALTQALTAPTQLQAACSGSGATAQCVVTLKPATSTTTTTQPPATTTTTTEKPPPTTTTTTQPSGSPGSCSTSAQVPPSSSTFGGYNLTASLTGAQIVSHKSTDGYNAYPQVELPPAGWISPSAAHIGVDGNAIFEKGFNDPSVGGGVVGAGMNVAEDTAPASGGGFTYCFSLSGNPSAWQQVGVVFIAWPQDQVWGDGEIDFMWAGAQSGVANWDIVEADGCTDTCQVLQSGTYPSGQPGTGPHTVTVLWNQGVGDSFYMDGKFIFTVPASEVGTPRGNEIPAMQVQDFCQCSSVSEANALTADLYWVATYTKS